MTSYGILAAVVSLRTVILRSLKLFLPETYQMANMIRSESQPRQDIGLSIL